MVSLPLHPELNFLWRALVASHTRFWALYGCLLSQEGLQLWLQIRRGPKSHSVVSLLLGTCPLCLLWRVFFQWWLLVQEGDMSSQSGGAKTGRLGLSPPWDLWMIPHSQEVGTPPLVSLGLPLWMATAMGVLEVTWLPTGLTSHFSLLVGGQPPMPINELPLLWWEHSYRSCHLSVMSFDGPQLDDRVWRLWWSTVPVLLLARWDPASAVGTLSRRPRFPRPVLQPVLGHTMGSLPTSLVGTHYCRSPESPFIWFQTPWPEWHGHPP